MFGIVRSRKGYLSVGGKNSYCGFFQKRGKSSLNIEYNTMINNMFIFSCSAEIYFT